MWGRNSPDGSGLGSSGTGLGHGVPGFGRPRGAASADHAPERRLAGARGHAHAPSSTKRPVQRGISCEMVIAGQMSAYCAYGCYR